jgi:hypothetical protein
MSPSYFRKRLAFTQTAVADLYVVRSFQEVLFGFQSAMARFCRLLPRHEGARRRTKYKKPGFLCLHRAQVRVCSFVVDFLAFCLPWTTVKPGCKNPTDKVLRIVRDCARKMRPLRGSQKSPVPAVLAQAKPSPRSTTKVHNPLSGTGENQKFSWCPLCPFVPLPALASGQSG